MKKTVPNSIPHADDAPLVKPRAQSKVEQVSPAPRVVACSPGVSIPAELQARANATRRWLGMRPIVYAAG